MEDIWNQMPGKCPAAIQCAIGFAQETRLEEETQPKLLQYLSEWLFSPNKEYPLPNTPVYWKYKS
jgi:hypothetical protein